MLQSDDSIARRALRNLVHSVHSSLGCSKIASVSHQEHSESFFSRDTLVYDPPEWQVYRTVGLPKAVSCHTSRELENRNVECLAESPTLRFSGVVKADTRLKIVTLEDRDKSMISFSHCKLPTLRFSIWYCFLRRCKTVTLTILRDIQRYDFLLRRMYRTEWHLYE